MTNDRVIERVGKRGTGEERRERERERENTVPQRHFGESCFDTPGLKNSKVFMSTLRKSLEEGTLCKCLGFLRS